MFRTRPTWTVLGVLLLFAGPAQADPAELLLKKGIRLYAVADFDGSLKKLKDAYGKTRAPKTLGRILLYMGCNHAEKGEADKARKAFKNALKIHPSLTIDPRGLKPAIVKVFLEVRDSLMGSLSVQTTPSGALVKLDGNEVGKTPVYLHMVGIGGHVVAVRREGYAEQTRVVTVAPDQVKTVTLTLKKVAAAFTASQPASAPTEPTEPKVASTAVAPPGDQQVKATDIIPRAPSHEDVMQTRRQKTTWAYVMLGVSGAAATTMAVLYGVGKAKGDEAYAEYIESSDPEVIADYHRQLDDAETMMAVGHGMLALSVAALGVSIYQLLSRPELPADFNIQDAGASIRLDVMPTAGGAGVVLGGRF